MEFLKVGVAQHQPVVGVPQNESLRDRFDGIAQAHVCRDCLFHEAFLLRDIDCDPDEMQARLVDLPHELTARAQPYPMPVRVAHAESMVDCGHRCIGKLDGKLV